MRSMRRRLVSMRPRMVTRLMANPSGSSAPVAGQDDRIDHRSPREISKFHTPLLSDGASSVARMRELVAAGMQLERHDQRALAARPS